LKVLPLNRPAAALLGSVLMVACGVLTPDQGVSRGGLQHLGAAARLSLLSAYFCLAGFFDWAADWVLKAGKTPERLLLYLILTSGTLSALVGQRHVCFMFTPLVVAVVVRGKTAIAALPAGAGDEREHRQRVHAGRQSAKHDCRQLSKLSFARFSASLLPVARLGLEFNTPCSVSAFRDVLRQRDHLNC